LQVPYHRPTIGAEEIQEVIETLESGWLTTGPRTARFERDFAEYTRTPFAQAVNSCTSGLHLALTALDIGPGDEVITTPLTFCATVNVILHSGATPVLADIDQDGNIDAASAATKMTARTRAMIPVHLAGLPCDMDAIWSLAGRHGVDIIEDCAHAVGAHYRGVPIGGARPETGAPSAAAVFSFYATKNLTTGEGGMVTTFDENFAARLKTLCLHGISKNSWNRYADRGSWHYDVLEPGFKYNLTDLQSALGIHQLRKIERFTAERERLAALYCELLGDLEEVLLPRSKAECRHAWHLFMLRLNLERLSIDRATFIAELQKRGVGTSVHFIPIPLHPAYGEMAARPENQVPRALALYPRLISLPLYPAMSEDQVAFTAEAVREIARKHRVSRFWALTAAAS
jgi:dTDP-4-amino-4,6-dideoxygalactose transaminase